MTTADDTVLITGGLGFLGRRLAEAFAQRGHHVVVLDNGFRAHRHRRSERRVTTIEGDIRDPDTVERAVRGTHTVLHLAAIQGTGNFYRVPELVLDVNLKGTLNVAEACARCGVRRLLFASSSEVYGHPSRFPTPESSPLAVPDVWNARYSYGGSKIAGELIALNYARRFGFAVTVVRYHNVYGPAMGWDHVIPQFIRRLALGQDFTVQGDGEQARSFCFVDDAVDATVAAAILPGGVDAIFNIGNPREEYTINQLVELLADIRGAPIAPRHVPVEGEGVRRRVPDIALAKERLAFAPHVTLPEGLRQTYRWYVDELRLARANCVS